MKNIKYTISTEPRVSSHYSIHEALVDNVYYIVAGKISNNVLLEVDGTLFNPIRNRIWIDIRDKVYLELEESLYDEYKQTSF